MMAPVPAYCLPHFSALLLFLLALTPIACTDAPAPDADAASETLPPSIAPSASADVVYVSLTSQQADDLRIATRTVETQPIAYPVEIPGEVHPDPDHFARVSAPIGGRVTRIYAHEGEAVRRGAPLLTLESLEYASLVADYLQAHAETRFQQRDVERLQVLTEKRIAPQSKFERALADRDRAKAAEQAALARLQALGLPTQTIAAWQSDSTANQRPFLTVYAPISGKIDAHLIDLGQAVSTYEELLTLINPVKVLIKGFAAPQDAGLLSVGSPVTVTGGPAGAQLEARITSINPAIDVENRAVPLNIETTTVQNWPDLQRFNHTLDAAQFGIRAARSSLIPGLQVEVFRQDFGTGYDFSGFQVGLKVPLWWQNYRGRLRLAQAEFNAEQARRAAVRLTVNQAFEEAWQQYKTSHANIERYQQMVQAHSDTLLALTQEGYTAGEVDLITLLDTQRTYLASRRRYVRTLRDYLKSLATLERFRQVR